MVYNKRSNNLPPGAVYVGRPTKWGNPFLVGLHGPRLAVIARYALYLRSHPELVEAARRELRDKDLICWCAPKACHAHVLELVAGGADPVDAFHKVIARIDSGELEDDE